MLCYACTLYACWLSVITSLVALSFVYVARSLFWQASPTDVLSKTLLVNCTYNRNAETHELAAIIMHLLNASQNKNACKILAKTETLRQWKVLCKTLNAGGTGTFFVHYCIHIQR